MSFRCGIKEQNAHSSQSKDELMKEFKRWIPVFNKQTADDVFDWFYSKLSQKEQEIDRLKKELEELKTITKSV